ncbi:TPA: hypothetical protein ACKP0L_003899 [Pseudomonas putida]|uniref:hypothetical protein n=1 Tax=Pseudomonas putida TaxID=303 RepID=UPI000F3C8A12|nr:hypothetical protein [Pseudomonas putida]RNF69033.1 hypothetical protein EFJ98_18245 [Pseudomonas putida]
MSEQILAKLDAIQTTIADLRAEVGGLQAQVLTKADSTAVSALSSTVRGHWSRITSQGGMITAQGQAITSLTSRIDLPCGCNKADATAETALDATRIQSSSGAISIDFGKGLITVANPNGPIVLGNLDAAKGRQVFISETSVASAAIAAEVSARASADEVLCSRIGALSSALNGSDLADVVRQVIRKELQPGGLLHRR